MPNVQQPCSRSVYLDAMSEARDPLDRLAAWHERHEAVHERRPTLDAEQAAVRIRDVLSALLGDLRRRAPEGFEPPDESEYSEGGASDTKKP